MRSYQFQNLPSKWSEPQPISIFVLTPVITVIRTQNVNIDIKYLNNVPNVRFAARVTWCESDVKPSITIKQYDVWISNHSTNTPDPSETAFIDQSVGLWQ